MKFLSLSICFFLLISLFVALEASATTYYVSPTGNDNDLGTLNEPWKTINKANNELLPGDIVYLREGTYQQTIRPTRSGNAGQYITYSRYQNEVPRITNVNIGINLDSRSYIVIDGLTVDGNSHGPPGSQTEADVDKWMSMTSSSRNIVKNCNFQYARSGIQVREGSNYNVFQNNIMHYVYTNLDPPKDSGNMIILRASNHNLIENNDMAYSGHNLITIPRDSNYNVVRNNNLHSHWHRAHMIAGSFNVFEGNYVSDSSSQITKDPDGGKNLGRNNIYRRNMFHSNEFFGFRDTTNKASPETYLNRIYNNVAYGNGQGMVNIQMNSGTTAYDIMYKNNIAYNNQGSRVIDISPSGSSDPFAGRVFNNNILLGGNIDTKAYGFHDVSWYQQNHPANFMNNIAVNPQFVNPNATLPDFRLQSGSPAIDEGAFLTQTSSFGSGTTMNVEDALYFTDGLGIIEGDLIQLEGQTQTARITNISGNTITLDTPLSWNNNQGVSLAYNGSAPDIGAYEYVSGGTPPPDTNPPSPPFGLIIQ
ncbi:MAG: hypothetical protein ACE5KZ_10565 [Candidatus Scalinduaceae bacterium]